ncbi:hypothetical protein KJ840_01065 [Patescibacteria group bacterium]|nr:hypothetical protein [Patescibacteria group bacterium]
MAEIFDPKLMVNGKKNIWQQHGFKIILIFTLIILLISGYLIYRSYLSPSYELYQLLPQKYDISFEFKADRFIFPDLQKKQFLENESLNRIYQEVQKEIKANLLALPAESQEFLNKFQHLIFFASSAENFGLVGKIPNKKVGRQLTELNFPGLYTQTIKKQIFIISNNRDLLKEMASQKLSASTLPYFSVSISPWLKVKVQHSFFIQQYASQTLVVLQQIFWPLSLTDKNYSLELNSGFKSLELLLAPESPDYLNTSAVLNIKDLLTYLPADSRTVIGLADLQILTENLEKNDNLQNIFRDFDSYFWLNYQISLSNLLKNIQNPFLIGLDDQNWRIVTSAENINLADYYLRQYFGQFKPKTQEITLPDGSKAIELINNPKSVKFIEQTIDNWEIKQFSGDSSENIGYAQKDNILIIGNNLTEIFSNDGSWHDFQKEDISVIFSFKPLQSQLKSSDFLKDFTEITAIMDNLGQIKVYLELQ